MQKNMVYYKIYFYKNGSIGEFSSRDIPLKEYSLKDTRTDTTIKVYMSSTPVTPLNEEP